MSGHKDLRPEMLAFRPERADFTPERADFKPGKADFKPERTDFKPESQILGLRVVGEPKRHLEINIDTSIPTGQSNCGGGLT